MTRSEYDANVLLAEYVPPPWLPKRKELALDRALHRAPIGRLSLALVLAIAFVLVVA